MRPATSRAARSTSSSKWCGRCTQAGIEVILDVVFNHTAEGNEYGPTLSFKGLENRVYYMLANGGSSIATTPAAATRSTATTRSSAR